MKKGFTLVELLAVIVILGVISMVTYGIVTNNIKTTKKKSFEISAQNLLESSKEYVTKHMDNNDFPEGGIEVTSEELELKNNPFISGIVKKDENGQIVLENVTDGNYCANGTKNSMEINEGTCGGETDETLPTLKVKQLKVGTTTAQIMVKTQDSGSGIKEYIVTYEKKEKKENDETITTTYEKEGTKTLIKEVVKLEGLNPNTEYKITVTSINKSSNEDIQTITKELKIKTLEVEAPEFRISTKTHATNKMLEIIYPVNDGNYEYFYNTVIYDKDTKEKITKEYTTEETKVELKIEEAMEVEAYIKKGVDIVAQNSITIGGIDLNGPIVNLVVPKPTEWSQSKILEIESQDNVGGVGLALRPYSFDGGKNWVKSNTQELKTSISKLDIRSRDRLGNVNQKFKENGSDYDCDAGEEAQTICSLKTIDSVAPKIKIEVIEGTTVEKYPEWYNSDKVVLKVTLTDYYLLDGKETIGGSGIIAENEIGKVTEALTGTVTNTNKVPLKADEINFETEKANVSYSFTLTESGTYEIVINAKDIVGNVGTATATINIDNVIPVITAIADPLSLGTGPYTFTDNLNVTYGPLGGNAECSPPESRKTASYEVECTATGNNELETDNTNRFKFSVRHSYAAEAYQYNYTGTCGSKDCSYNKCEDYTCSYCDSDCSAPSEYMCYYTTEHCDCHRNCKFIPNRCPIYCPKSETRYRCKSGDRLEGTICYYQ